MTLAEAFAPTLAEGSLSALAAGAGLPEELQGPLTAFAAAADAAGAKVPLQAKTAFMEFIRKLSAGEQPRRTDMKGIQSSTPSPAKTAARAQGQPGGMVGKPGSRVG